MNLEIHPFTRKFLHFFSVSGTFLILFGSLSLLQMYLFYLIFNVNYYENPILPFLFAVVSVITILKFFSISSPYK